MRKWFLALLLAIAPLGYGHAQSDDALATLVADRVSVEPGQVLVAEGGVEVIYRGARLTAPRISYDGSAERLAIDGPLTLEDERGTLVLADAAALDADLRNGILASARLVLDRQLQIAAQQAVRAQGRYTRLSNTVASSCEICATDPTPTWEIRARTIIHDEIDGYLYLDRATFRLFGLPVLYLPQLRLPDPKRTRAPGLLIPRIESTSQLGIGLKLPVFVPLGQSADVTLTPYLSPQTATLEMRYRQAFRRGTLDARGAVSNDTLHDDQRYYLFADGAFRLPEGFRLRFDVQQVSDEAYLFDYDYSETDRLRTGLEIVRAERDELLSFDLSSYETLRDAEADIEDELPHLAFDSAYERRLPLGAGELRFGVDLAALRRRSEADRIGRDVVSLGLGAAYLRRTVLPGGLVVGTRAGADVDLAEVQQDAAFSDLSTRFVPSVSAELRMPMARTGAGGARWLLEPVAQIAYSRAYGEDVPNEDSLLVEIDEGNLFSLSRFPGDDRVETGLRANLGAQITRVSPDGWTSALSFGRILRADDQPDLLPGTGLGDSRSDWLAAARLQLGNRVDIATRALFGGDFSLRKREARVIFDADGFDLEGTYTFLDAEPGENRPLDVHELTLDAGLRLSRHWIGSVEGRYDFGQSSTTKAGFGLGYRTECIEIDLGLERRFTETAAIEPSTSVSLGLRLAGIGGTARNETFRKRCAG